MIGGGRAFPLSQSSDLSRGCQPALLFWGYYSPILCPSGSITTHWIYNIGTDFGVITGLGGTLAIAGLIERRRGN